MLNAGTRKINSVKRKNHLRILIRYPQQCRKLPLTRQFAFHHITNLNIDRLSIFLANEINLFLLQTTDPNIISPSNKFPINDCFKRSFNIPGNIPADNRIAHSMIDPVNFFVHRQNALTY